MKKSTLLSALMGLLFVSVQAEEPIHERNFQFSFVSPLGTNGLQSHVTTNKTSVNLLGGYSQANRAFEFGGLYNINREYTQGVQLAGLFNYSGETREAVQVAGITNIATQGSSAFQLSGIVNIASKVSGMQVGLVNIADECDGVQLGLVNIVKRGGKQEFELSFSEVLHTTATFKLGTNHLYTLFSAGVNYANTPLEYAAGVGLGSDWAWNNRWGNQVELLCYSMTTGGEFTTDLNLLTQLRYTISREFAPHFKLFAGPVLNLAISDYVNPETGVVGATYAPWSHWSSSNNGVATTGWIGVTAGCRF